MAETCRGAQCLPMGGQPVAVRWVHEAMAWEKCMLEKMSQKVGCKAWPLGQPSLYCTCSGAQRVCTNSRKRVDGTMVRLVGFACARLNESLLSKLPYVQTGGAAGRFPTADASRTAGTSHMLHSTAPAAGMVAPARLAAWLQPQPCCCCCSYCCAWLCCCSWWCCWLCRGWAWCG